MSGFHSVVTEQEVFICAVCSFIGKLLRAVLPDVAWDSRCLPSEDELSASLDDVIWGFVGYDSDACDCRLAMAQFACKKMKRVCDMLKNISASVGLQDVAPQYLDGLWFIDMLLRKDTSKLNKLYYTIDFTDAIADNNEGNVYPGFTYVFSTGDVIDSMMITGIVQDCNTLQPVKGAKVLLYKNHADSAVFLERPFAAAISDDWGYFCIRNIQDTLYRLYAITDGNNDNMYNPESETVAFIDSLIRPVMVVNDSLPEVIKYEMKDTVNCQRRKTEYELNLFKEKNAKQVIVNKVRLDDRTNYITFMAPTHTSTRCGSGASLPTA